MPDPTTLSLPFNPAGIELDRRKGLSRQLYQALRLRVLDGRLASGTRLPASRDLAAALAISATAWCVPTISCMPKVSSKAGSGTALMWRSCRNRWRPRKIIHKSIHRVFNKLTHSLIHNFGQFHWEFIQQSYPQRCIAAA